MKNYLRPAENFLFAPVPAWRFAAFRTLFGFLNLVYFTPRFSALVRSYADCPFRIPLIPGLPELPAEIIPALIGIWYVASLFLFLGVFSRLGAGFLVLIGLCVMLSEKLFYSHSGQLHLILLAIIACSRNRLSLIDLFRPEKRDSCREEAWPEHLVRFQLSIVFFYTALDKLYSPFWGTAGTFFVHEWGGQNVTFLKRAVLKIPGAASVGIILLEFFLAAAFLLKPFWKWAFWGGFLFVILIQLTIKPALFSGDILAALILFLPAKNP